MKHRSYAFSLGPLFKSATIPKKVPATHKSVWLAHVPTPFSCRDVLHQSRLPRASFSVYPVNSSAFSQPTNKIAPRLQSAGFVVTQHPLENSLVIFSNLFITISHGGERRVSRMLLSIILVILSSLLFDLATRGFKSYSQGSRKDDGYCRASTNNARVWLC